MKSNESKVVGVRVTLDEYAILLAMSKTFKMSISRLIHEMLSIGFDIATSAENSLNEEKGEEVR